MTATRTVAGLIPTAMGVGLLGYNIKTLNKKKLKSKDLIGLAVTDVVGLSLIGATSQAISGL